MLIQVGWRRKAEPGENSGTQEGKGSRKKMSMYYKCCVVRYLIFGNCVVTFMCQINFLVPDVYYLHRSPGGGHNLSSLKKLRGI